MKIRSGVALALGGVLFAAGPPGSLDAQPAGTVHELVPERSELYVLVDREGVLSFLGHEHVIAPRQWEGSFCWRPEVPEEASGEVVVATAALVIDAARDREAVGMGEGPSAEDVEEIQEKLLDAERLHAEAHPELRLSVRELEGSTEGQLTARGEIQIRGSSREVEFPVEVEDDGSGELRVAGRFRLRQTDVGIEPESVARVVRVADEVEIRFDVIAAATGADCD